MLRLGAGTVRVLAAAAEAKTAKANAEERNIRALLLKNRALSRGNWRGRAISAKIKLRRPRQKRGERHIEKPGLKHEQERYRQKLPVAHSVPHEVAEINREG